MLEVFERDHGGNYWKIPEVLKKFKYKKHSCLIRFQVLAVQRRKDNDPHLALLYGWFA